MEMSNKLSGNTQISQFRILIVEDEFPIRLSLAAFLEDSGYLVSEAENGRIGLEKFELESPDLVLLDLRMPEVDGLEVLGKITNQSPDTPVIVVSGSKFINDVVEALHRGAWDYLIKPLADMEMLVYAVKKALERSRLIKENKAYRENLEEMVRLRTAQLEAANKELRETRLQIIQRLGKAAEYKDNETGKHVMRVSCYSRILAEGLGFDQDKIDLIYQSSLMHDLGKIGIPDNILQKTGPLDPEEERIMHKHTHIGNEMLQPLHPQEIALYCQHTIIGKDILNGSDGSDSPLLETARKIAAYHHEHWDGSGYPYGLKGEEIPIEARIVTMADVYDALSSKRYYKQALPKKDCLEIVKDLSGNILDPQIVDVFFKLYDRILQMQIAWKD
ncbi:MAG: response regulator [Acidobacteria bacterium]|jgi:putative two-component system response regulator|nr:response regulator [Acidobacteriota bacterium]